MSDNTPYVTLTVENGIGTIEFFHPASNSLPGTLLQELADTVTKAGTEEEIKVIILKSAGSRAFCAGASFDELVAISDAPEGLRFFNGFAQVINAMRNCPKFIITRIQGKAVGGGVGLVAASDYAIATHKAAIKLSELAIGIGPFVVGPAVARKVGMAAFSALAIDATSWQTAAWAREKGLYTQVFDELEQVDQAVGGLAGQLSKSSPEAMAELKRVLWAGTDHWEQLLPERAAISGKLVLSDFTRNAIRDFKQKN